MVGYTLEILGPHSTREGKRINQEKGPKWIDKENLSKKDYFRQQTQI